MNSPDEWTAIKTNSILFTSFVFSLSIQMKQKVYFFSTSTICFMYINLVISYVCVLHLLCCCCVFFSDHRKSPLTPFINIAIYYTQRSPWHCNSVADIIRAPKMSGSKKNARQSIELIENIFISFFVFFLFEFKIHFCSMILVCRPKEIWEFEWLIKSVFHLFSHWHVVGQSPKHIQMLVDWSWI